MKKKELKRMMKLEFENGYKKKVFVILPLIGIDIPERYLLVYFICFGFKVSFKKTYPHTNSD